MADHMVISVGCSSQIKYIYIEDLVLGPDFPPGQWKVGVCLGGLVCVCSLCLAAVNHTLVERVLRGKIGCRRA